MSDHNPMPGTGSIADSVEFVKKLWGIPSAGALPGMLIPTLSLEEINKKIADLKAVESWMAVNMNMLRGTIQALEVQSATIVNLQSMGAMMSSPKADGKPAPGPTNAFPFSFPNWPPAGAQDNKPATAPPPPPTPAPEPVFTAPAEPVAASRPATADKGNIEPSGGMPNANAWWDLLQNQFKQAVSTALIPEALTPPGKIITKTAKPSTEKPAVVAARKTPAKPGAKTAAKPVARKASAKAAAGGRKK
jgi:hypothetical protein